MTTTRPVLGIICCQRAVGTEPAQAVMERYVRAAMHYADVAALLIPSLPDLMTAAEVAPRLDGVLLTGSPSNVEGHRYAEDAGDGPFDPGRDEIALSMVDAMIGRGRPVFGICRGFQEINVALAARCAATPPRATISSATIHPTAFRLTRCSIMATASISSPAASSRALTIRRRSM